MTEADRLERVFCDVLNNDAIRLRDDMTAADVEGWDSVAHINLMFAIEQEFGIHFRANELGEMAHIGELRQFIREHLATNC